MTDLNSLIKNGLFSTTLAKDLIYVKRRELEDEGNFIGNKDSKRVEWLLPGYATRINNPYTSLWIGNYFRILETAGKGNRLLDNTDVALGTEMIVNLERAGYLKRGTGHPANRNLAVTSKGRKLLQSSNYAGTENHINYVAMESIEIASKHMKFLESLPNYQDFKTESKALKELADDSGVLYRFLGWKDGKLVCRYELSPFGKLAVNYVKSLKEKS